MTQILYNHHHHQPPSPLSITPLFLAFLTKLPNPSLHLVLCQPCFLLTSLLPFSSCPSIICSAHDMSSFPLFLLIIMKISSTLVCTLIHGDPSYFPILPAILLLYFTRTQWDLDKDEISETFLNRCRNRNGTATSMRLWIKHIIQQHSTRRYLEYTLQI